MDEAEHALGAGFGPAHRPTEHAGREGDDDLLGVRAVLRAEATTDVGGDHPHLGGLDPTRRGEAVAGSVGELCGGPLCEVFDPVDGLPLGERGSRLQRARREADPGGGAEVIRAPMPGTVVSVTAQAGGEVEAGALLLTIESMKLETAITAPHAARVAEVCVAAGATFDQGHELVRLEAPEAQEETSR